MFKSKDLLYHSIAILTVIIWGTTFVSTKILINTGLSPVEILLVPVFVLAYFCILTIAHRRLWANCVKDEFLLFLSPIMWLSYFSGEYGIGHHIGFQRFIIDLYSTDHYNGIVSPIL